MKTSEQVIFLEQEVEAFEEMYKKEIQKELNPDTNRIYLENLTRYDWASSLENHFYPLATKTHGSIGLILPFRKLIFHSLPTSLLANSEEELLMDALNNLSDRRGYGLEYHEFAWQHEPVINGLLRNKLPVSKL